MDTKVIVVGAGAAGLAAARRLHEAGVATLVLEARSRIGGRIQTDHSFAAVPIELGAELIHGEHAVTHALAREAGLAVAPVDRYGGLHWAAAGPARPLDALPAQLHNTIRALFAAYKSLAASEASEDRSLADELRARGFAPEALAIADVLLAQTCCAPLASLSCADLARELRVDHAGAQEFRLLAGYDRLLGWLARPLPLVLDAPVSMVRQVPEGVEVVAGERLYRAQRCVLAVPVALLNSGAIAFDPPLSSTKREAIAAFRTAPASKYFYRFDQVRWPPELTYMAHAGLFARWWTPAHHAPGVPVLCAYVTAERARELDALPEEQALRQGLGELSRLLGEPALGAHYLAGRRKVWAADPYACGGYAHLPPGFADARPALAAPEGGLHFAGEATAYNTNPQTVHGAIESGWRAAAECLETL